ncbi:type II secretion system protein GspL [Gilvimarinus sp. F26214L]|uniref:type II secretion system protein GspL n=1 Tax=Gilvimarinus sp. DZF01 TaxID=3461371 RepID=UPI0040461B55
MATTSYKPLAVEALIKQIHRDEDGVAVYRWRPCTRTGEWLGPAREGDGDALREALPGSNLEVCLLLSGTEVVTQRVPFSSKERRHLARLVPYELEDDLTTELDELHFAIGKPGDGVVPTAYVNREWLVEQIQDLEALGFEVSHCIPEPLLLPRPEAGWTLRLDDELQAHYGPGLGFAVEASMTGPALASLADSDMPQQLLLMADRQEELDQLYESLPAPVHEHLTELEIELQLSERWDSLALDRYDSLDLRQGELARQLPIRKWWREWRTVAVVAGIALFAYVGVNIARMQVNNNATAELREEINAAFREVVPQGVIANPEQQLRSKIAEFQGESSGRSVVEMLAAIGPLIAENDEVIVRRLTYNDQRDEMQVTLEAESNSDILDLSNAINAAGLRATPQNMSRAGDRQQANMTITRAAQ